MLVAFVGVGSAYAFETTMCKTGTETPYCASENAYPSGTILAAETSKIRIATSIVNITCSSQLKAETTSQAGAPLPLKMLSWTFSSCHDESEGKCTASVSNLPSNGSLTRTNSWNGTLDAGSGGSGEALLSAQCGAFIQCNWDAAIGFEGGTPAFVDTTLVAKSGALCPKTATLEGHSYTFTSPLTHVFLAVPGKRPAKTTGFCKTFEEYCEPANLYPAGTVLNGKSTNFTINTPAGYGGGNFTCKSTTIKAETTAAYGEPLGMNSSEIAPAECEWSFGPCGLVSEGSFTGSVHRTTIPDGLWEGGGLSWRTKCGASLACTFTVKSGSALTVEHGTPGKITMNKVPLTVKAETTICPESATASGTFTFTSPSGGFFVSDVLR
jgi:hypothetical protein